MGGSISDDDDDDTQPFDSPLPSANSKGKEFDHRAQSTLPLLETVPFEDGLETQVINFEGDTQLPIEDRFETQVMDFDGETQVLDDCVGFNNMDTQSIDEWSSEKDNKTDGEESDKTELLCDTDELSDNDSGKIVGCSSEDWENTTISKQDDKEKKAELDALFFNQASAGVKINFTSIRAAAIRASGLAARNKALSKSNSELSSLKNEKELIKKDHVFEDNYATSTRDDMVFDGEQRKEIIDESKGENGFSAVRRLFMNDDKLDENEEPNDYTVNDVAGLSYVDSQEPGDLSQANALDFVDKFLKSNDTDIDKGVATVGPIVKKSKPESTIKGTQILAKKSRLKSLSSENGIYDWDDNVEDEGGGDFFSRQKKVLFDNEDKGLFNSRSRKTAKKAKVDEIRKDLTKELDEQLNVGFSNGIKATCSENDLQDAYNVGPDTQMAAEAMEVLCLGLDVMEKDNSGITESTHTDSSTTRRDNKKSTCNNSSTKRNDDKSLPKKNSVRKRPSPASNDDLSKKSKKSRENLSNESSVLPSKRNKSVTEHRKDCDLNKSNVILPSNGHQQDHFFTPIASRTRKHTGTVTCDIGTLSYEKGKRSNRKMSDNGYLPVNQSSGSKTNMKSCQISNGLIIDPQSFSVITRKTRSSLRAGKVLPTTDTERVTLEDGNFKCKLKEGKSNLELSPGERSNLTASTATTPASCTSSVAASPICMGDEYLKQSCRKNLVREIDSLVSCAPDSISPMKELRRRREMANVRVLFSHHLNGDVIKHQKKIIAKLGASVAPSIRESTHFVTDKFVRTRNMLEAIALGKPVVTHLWLESCGQASCFIDEKNYILRDAKKEKEFGFSLTASLAHACDHPLLQGIKVWITPRTKPGVEILSSLVKAVHGLPLERIGRSVLNEEKIPDDLLALSCEEDYDTCIPFLEKGGMVFSSELLLNGIVTQKLEFERHQLFDHLHKKTRSNRWPKRARDQYLPGAKRR